MKCPNCGSESTGKFCVYCGAPMPQEDSSQNAYQASADNNGQTYHQQDSWQQQTSYQQDWQANGYQANNHQQSPYSQGTPADLPSEYRPISMWGYFGYQILFSIPCIGFIFLLIFSFGGTQNVNVKNFARSYFCFLIIAIVLILLLMGISGGSALIHLY